MSTASALHHPTVRISNRHRRGLRRVPRFAAPPADIEFTFDNRRPGTAGFARWAAAAGQRIDRCGLAESARDVDNLVDVARRFGVSSAAVDVVADTQAPDVARIRAFAVVVSALMKAH